MEVMKRSSRSSQCHFAMNSILLVWTTCQAHSSVRLALCEILKRRANFDMKGWDDEAKDIILQCMMFETVESVQ